MPVTFDHPPVNEVALGKTFFVRPDFLIPHYGLLWERLRDRYPQCRHAPTLFNSNSSSPFPFGAVLLPRIWMLSSDERQLVQIQQDRLYFNWRQLNNEGDYIRFPAVEEEYIRVARIVDEFCGSILGSPLQTTGMELTYVNIIPLSTDVEIADQLTNILRDFKWDAVSDRFLMKPVLFTSQTDWSLPRGMGGLSVKIAAGSEPEGRKLLRLEIAASSTAGQSSIEETAWIEVAHNQIVQAFKDLTTTSMHEKWGLRP